MRFGLPVSTGLLLVLLASLAAHVPACRGGFAYDDFRFVVENGELVRGGNPLRFLADPATANPGRVPDIYRPIRTLAFSAERAAFGEQAGPFHAVSVVLHAANAALVYLLLIRFGFAAAAAAAGAALFAVHPAQVEAVAWISSQGDLLSALFLLLAVLSWTRSRGLDRPFLASLGLGVLACLSKESAVAFPALLLLADLARPGGGTAAVRARGALWAAPVLLALAFAILVRVLLSGAGGSPGGGIGHITGWWGGSWGANLATALRAGAFQVLFAVLPARPVLDWYMDPSAGLLDGGAFLALLLLGGLAAAGARALLRAAPPARAAGAGVLWAFAACFLTSHLLFPVGIPTAERFLYAGLAGVAAVAAWAFGRAARAGPRLAPALAVVAVASLGAISWVRAAAWRDDEACFRAGTAGAYSPRAAGRELNRKMREGSLLLSSAAVADAAGPPGRARRLREEARYLFAGVAGDATLLNAWWLRRVGRRAHGDLEAKARRNLALALLRLGDPKAALRSLEEADLLDGESPRGLRLMAEALEGLGRFPRAGWLCERGLEKQLPGDPFPPEIAARILNGAAAWRVSRGLDGAALRALRRSAGLAPHPGRNPAVSQLPDLEKAVAAKRAALAAAAERAPSDAGLAVAAAAYEGLGGGPAAGRKAFDRRWKGAPEDPALRALWARATMEADDTEDGWRAAEGQHRETLGRWPGDLSASLGLARCREILGGDAEAAALWRKVLADPASPPEARAEAEEGLARVSAKGPGGGR